MRLAVVGTGYVGLVTGTCFAEMGNDVICVDVDEAKIERLTKGVLPIYEPGLSEMVKENVARGQLRFTTKLADALANRQLVFIAVGTPMGEDGSADLSAVLAVAKDIGRLMTGSLIVVDKSTVPVGTRDKVYDIIKGELQARGMDFDFDVVSNPEFLKEGAACEDFLRPDRVVIGADSPKSLEKMHELYTPFILNEDAFIPMDTRSAELTKYAANAMLATKISFMNELAAIAERSGADINKVRRGIGSDKRIGYRFIYPGCGYGGSCFPKDVEALIATAKEFGHEAKVLIAVEEVNHRQKSVLAEKIVRVFGEDLSGRRFAVWGLAFKPGTDDMRYAPAIVLIKELVARGAEVAAYDPKAREQAESCYLKDVPVTYAQSKYDAVRDADALVLVTEWKEFRSPDFEELKMRLKSPCIFDGRNQYKAETLLEMGFYYEQIGVKPLGSAKIV